MYDNQYNAKNYGTLRGGIASADLMAELSAKEAQMSCGPCETRQSSEIERAMEALSRELDTLDKQWSMLCDRLAPVICSADRPRNPEGMCGPQVFMSGLAIGIGHHTEHVTTLRCRIAEALESLAL